MKSRLRMNRSTGHLILGIVTAIVALLVAGELVEKLLAAYFPGSAHKIYPLLRISLTSLLTALWTIALSHRLRKKQEESVLDSCEKYKGIFEHSSDAILLIDPEGLCREWNSGAESIYGFSREEVIGKPLPTIPEDRRDEFKSISAEVKKGKSLVGVETKRLCKNGESKDIVLSVSPLLDSSGAINSFISIGRDITEQKRTRKKIHETEKLFALSEMASLFAHEIRNPITGISCAMEILKKSGSKENHEKEIIEEIAKLAKRLDKTVNDLLEYARPGFPRFRTHDVNAIIERAVNLAKENCPDSSIEIEKTCEEGVNSIELDPKQMERAFFNTILNSFQAMNGKGKLTITAHSADESITVSFSDTGEGIPSGAFDHIFDPFFTTRHKGAGLGLPIVKNVVDAHGGEIKVESKAGEGSTFTFVLPKRQKVKLKEAK